MKRQLWQEQFNRRDPDEEPWKQSFVTLLQTVWKKTSQ